MVMAAMRSNTLPAPAEIPAIVVVESCTLFSDEGMLIESGAGVSMLVGVGVIEEGLVNVVDVEGAIDCTDRLKDDEIAAFVDVEISLPGTLITLVFINVDNDTVVSNVIHIVCVDNISCLLHCRGLRAFATHL